MLKRLGFGRTKRVVIETNFQLPDHVTTTKRKYVCLLESKTIKESIHLKASPIKSNSFYLSATYKENGRFSNGDLAGHIFPLPLRHDRDPKVLVLEHEIPKQFLVDEETFREHITMVLSKTSLASSTQKRLVTHVSKLEAIKETSHRRGFKIEVEVNVNVDHKVDIGSGCKGEEACLSRVVSNRHVTKQVTGTDCPICLTELSGVVSRMELRCSHVFHTECVTKWFKKNTSCPICRAQALNNVSIY